MRKSSNKSSSSRWICSKADAAQEIAQLKENPDPVQQAMGRYQERMMSEMSTAFLPTREGDKLIIFRANTPEGQIGTMAATAVTGILVALLLPAVQAAREAARRNDFNEQHEADHAGNSQLADREKVIFRRIRYCRCPRQATTELASAYFPYIEQQALYNQFHLDEPWDSEHNKSLIAKMPAAL